MLTSAPRPRGAHLARQSAALRGAPSPPATPAPATRSTAAPSCSSSSTSTACRRPRSCRATPTPPPPPPATSIGPVGGFCEDYIGYGAEDTDYGQRARAAGVGLTWVGGAWAYHQHHATRPPAEAHAADILRNAERFRAHWGWTPMEGWLETAREHA